MHGHQGDATDFGKESMRATQLMIALVAGLSVLTLVSGLAAQQSTSSNATKLQRTDRNFVTKAAEGGRMLHHMDRHQEAEDRHRGCQRNADHADGAVPGDLA